MEKCDKVKWWSHGDSELGFWLFAIAMINKAINLCVEKFEENVLYKSSYGQCAVRYVIVYFAVGEGRVLSVISVRGSRCLAALG